MKITYEQMKRELTEIRYYYLMQGTYRERVDETQETLDLVEKYLPLIKKMPTKLKGYFIERYKNGSSISKMAEKWKVSNDFVVKVGFKSFFCIRSCDDDGVFVWKCLNWRNVEMIVVCVG